MRLTTLLLLTALTGCAETRVAGVRDQGIVIQHGNCPRGCDDLGARDVFVYRNGNWLVANYDGAGANGWFASQAYSIDGRHWKKGGAILSAGTQSSPDSASASYGTVYHNTETGKWSMFYLGTQWVSDSVNKVPSPPYVTLYAESKNAWGPWVKDYARQPFKPQPGTFYAAGASPGQIIRDGEQDYMFFAAGSVVNGQIKRTLGLACSLHGEQWQVDRDPILPPDEQIENSSLIHLNGMWFLFTNHIGRDANGTEYTDSVVMYWSHDLTHWHAEKRAIVLDSKNLHVKCIGLPSVTVMNGKLNVYYDTPGGDSTSHMGRNIGLATIDLPLLVRYR